MGSVVWLSLSTWSAPRVKLIVREGEVEFTNLLRRWRLPWSDMAEVCVQYLGIPSSPPGKKSLLVSGRTPPVLGFRLKSKTYVPRALATVYIGQMERERLTAVVAEHAASNGVPMDVDPSALSWSAYLTRG